MSKLKKLKLGLAGRLLFRLSVLTLLSWIAYVQYGALLKSHSDHVFMDDAREHDHQAIYGECKKPIL